MASQAAVGADAPLELPGLTLHEEIGRGAHSVVYRATRGATSYAVKVQNATGRLGESEEAALRFRRGGSLLACLSHPALPRIHDLGEVDGRCYLVLDYVEGQTLAERLASGPLGEGAILSIALDVGGALAEVHRVGMVHCDVKPSNILLDGSGAAHLIDFGFTVRAHGGARKEQVAGTLLYAAPEQTGMLKRPLDGRADLYSLGVVLYEAATGAPPFAADDAGELVRLHAVEPVPDLAERAPDLSPGLAAVIEKLLAKDPDDRYQSYAALADDLGRIESIRRSLADGVDPQLGRADHRSSLGRGPVELVGRRPVLEELVRQIDELRRRHGVLLLIDGEVGYGKTTLLRQVAAAAGERGLLVASGRCPADSAMPFAPFRSATAALIRHVEALPRAARRERSEWIRRAIGDTAPLLRRLSPRIAALVGEDDRGDACDAVEDQFLDAIARFLLRLAEAAGGLVLELDDAHLIDDGSRKVLGRLAPQLRESALGVVLAADRDGDGAAIDGIVEEFGGVLERHLRLPPLRDEDIIELVTHQLGLRGGERPSFAARIAERSDGNPLAAIEHVRGMLDAGLLRPRWGVWELDEAGLERLDLPTSVVGLLVRRLDDLDEEARDVLRAAAVIGVHFGGATLSSLLGEGARLAEGIGAATAARVVERVGADTWAFVHPAVREALEGELEPARVRELHERVALWLDEIPDASAEQVYATARHFAAGTLRKPARVVRAATRAGRRALAEYAHELAHEFFVSAETHAREAALELDSGFHESFGEVCTRTGRLAEAKSHYETALEGTDEPARRAHLRERLAHIHVANFHTEPAWREVVAGFGELGVRLPTTTAGRLLSTAWSWLRSHFAASAALRRSGPSREASDLDVLLVRLCEQGALSGYFGSKPLLLASMVLRAMPPAARLGPSPELVMAFSQHGVGYAAAGLRRRALWCVSIASRLAEVLDIRLVTARCELYRGFVHHLCGDSVEAERLLRAALDRHGPWLDSMHYVDGAGDLVFNLLLRGYFRDAWTWVERMLPRMWFTSGGVRARQGNPWAGPLLVALGRTTEGVEHQEQTEAFVRGAPRTEPYLWGEMLSYRLLFHIEQGELGEVVEATIEQHRALGLEPRWTSFHMRSFFLFQAFARLEQAMRAEGAERLERLAQLERALRELRAAAMIPALVAHADAIEGALARMRDQRRLARRRFARALALAARTDNLLVEYEVARQRAHLLRQQGLRPASLREARRALELALGQGWVFRAQRLRSELGLDGATSTRSMLAGAAKTARSSIGETSDARSLHLKRQVDALLQVSLATGTVFDPDEQSRVVLDEIVKILGAERAFLFRCEEGSARTVFQAGRDARHRDLEAPTGYSSTVVETVRARRQPMVVSGTDEGEIAGAESVVAHGIRSIVAAPLQVRERLVGVLYLDNRLARGVFTADDVDILQALGNHIAIALETARAAQLEIQVEAESRRRELADRLREMSHALSSTLRLEEVVQRLIDGLTGVVPYDRAAVMLVHEAGHLVLSASRGGEGDEGWTPASEPLLAEVLARREARLARGEPGEGGGSGSRLAAWMAIPLITKDRVAGVLTLESRQEGAYGAAEMEIAATFAGQAGIAVENARLFEKVQRMARIDELTNILNRRHFFVLAAREFSRARRYGRPLAAAMIDVDRFKRVNDTHGHAIGDEVLREVARRVSETIRDVDLLGRYGGEEFALLLPETEQGGAALGLAERIRRRLEQEPVETTRGPLAVTVSVGVASRDEGVDDVEALLDRADQALYRAKRAGRNRVECFE